jgi:hypothetical protein
VTRSPIVFCIINLDDELIAGSILKTNAVEESECQLLRPFLQPDRPYHQQSQTPYYKPEH